MIGLTTPVKDLKMIGPAYLTRLSKLGIRTVEDLLFHAPVRYEDFSIVTKINTLKVGETVTVTGEIIKFENIFSKSGKKIQKLQISDNTGSVSALFFNQVYLSSVFILNRRVSLSGEVKIYQNSLAFMAPQYEIIRPGLPTLHTGRLVPVYPETAGVSSKWLRSRIAPLLFNLNIPIPELMPEELSKKFNLLKREKALRIIHFPASVIETEAARKCLSFNELFIIQMASILRKNQLKTQKIALHLDLEKHRKKIEDFMAKLPFELTLTQKKAVTEILTDLTGNTPMNRLLEGDVGSGKTVVAVLAVYFCFLNGYRSVLMAPTEILARQHFRTFENFLNAYGLKISLITASEKPDFLNPADLPDIYIGTHALLNFDLENQKIALVIIDEQQRFGVKQRTTLRTKNSNNPHLLSMTATPIPRTVALTLYSDLDLSVIDEMPKGRLPVKTYVVPPGKRQAAYDWIKKEINSSQGQKKAFIICPLIEESESLLTVKSAKQEFVRLKKEIFPKLSLNLIHGKLKADEKNRIISGFKNGDTDILIATPVVEVGIDIPKATIIMIEASDRFGLSQLHQLRGRVGRGDLQSYCLLFTESKNVSTLQRLEMMEKNHIGIKLAEYDLKTRGPGQFFGTRQHGSLGLKFTDYADLQIIKTAKVAAAEFFSNHKSLNSFPYLQEKLLQYTIQTISPD